MGSGAWSTNVYSAAKEYRTRTGKSAFAYSDTMSGTNRADWRVHDSLDPTQANIRESRDSDEHPTSQAISVIFDVTGSMGSIPRTLQTKLPGLFGLLLRKGYLAHPQIMFGGIGDATCDRVPLQVGQFESDNRMDDDLGNIFLEGGGGGQRTESYELAMYFMARHTSMDCLEKRGRRGYLFLLGDEMAYGHVKASEVRDIIGDDVTEDIPLTDIVAELRTKFEVYFIVPGNAYHGRDAAITKFWRSLFGQNVIVLDDLAAVCETIALTIGLNEEAIDLAEGLEHLTDVGFDSTDVVGKALAPLASSRSIAVTPDSLDAGGALDVPGKAQRL